jgi:hypothetical protein
MAEFEVTIESSRGRFTSEPKALHEEKNHIQIGKHDVSIGVIPCDGSITLNPDSRLALTSLTDPENLPTRFIDDGSLSVCL